MRIVSFLLGFGLLIYSGYLVTTSGGDMFRGFILPGVFFFLGIVLVLVYAAQTLSRMIIRTLILGAMVVAIGWLIWSVYTGNPAVINALKILEQAP